jgi:hypothetical protein
MALCGGAGIFAPLQIIIGPQGVGPCVTGCIGQTCGYQGVWTPCQIMVDCLPWSRGGYYPMSSQCTSPCVELLRVIPGLCPA